MSKICKRFNLIAILAILTVLLLAACGDGDEQAGGDEADNGNGESAANDTEEEVDEDWEPTSNVEYIAPADAGGGWDTLIRTTAQVIDEEDLAPVNFAPVNVPGSGGAVAWAEIAAQAESDDLLFAASPPIILVPLSGTSQYDHNDFTPVSRLITDYSIVLVRNDSEFESIQDVFDAIEEDPGSVSVGGGSSAGSMDHISFAGAASEAGLNAGDVNYVPFDGGGEAMTNLLGGHVDVVSTGVGEAMGQVEAGELRPIAVSSEEPLDSMPDAETYIDQGIDYTFDIWRGIMGPPEMPASAVAYYENMYAEMLETESWEETRESHGWIDAYQDSNEFGEFLDEQYEQFEDVLTDIGIVEE
ncbi:Bug family tripartite tricarboxylate transporter substrate binding protein [Thalassorhabdus alkalitolerans]|uniref:Bug family tripartite tricarboxylate transporter substrate binding protein n=1 Tax=Thalassorhabdus alkalitolerans TaxID=2282697 RepID=A0ABW0YSR2_9BACI|nr:tripartite tricarboxylate transporter substrate-binding protein [Thalassobacillus sp. C254]